MNEKVNVETLYRSMTKDETIEVIKKLKQFLINDYCKCDTCKTKIIYSKNWYGCSHECDKIHNL